MELFPRLGISRVRKKDERGKQRFVMAGLLQVSEAYYYLVRERVCKSNCFWKWKTRGSIDLLLLSRGEGVWEMSWVYLESVWNFEVSVTRGRQGRSLLLYRNRHRWVLLLSPRRWSGKISLFFIFFKMRLLNCPVFTIFSLILITFSNMIFRKKYFK